MQKWEYISITWVGGKIYVGHEMVDDKKGAIPMPYMQKLGDQGWEMVTAVSETPHEAETGTISGGLRWYFKRPKA